MPWFKVDDGFWGHPKRLSCPLSAIGLWVAAGSWSAQQMTDGHVPAHVLTVLGGKPKDAAALVAAGLWTKATDGWCFHDWKDMQPTRAQTQARREEDAERKRQARAAKAEQRHVRDSSGRTSGTRPAGRPDDVRPESALPDPTRPDPTRSTSVVEEVGEAGGRRGQQREQHDDDALHGLLAEHADAVGPLSPASERALAQHVAESLQRAEPDQVREALRRYRARASSGQRTLPGLLPRLVDDVVQAAAGSAQGDDPLSSPDAVEFLRMQREAGR